MKTNDWSGKEIELLRLYYHSATRKELENLFPGKALRSISMKAINIGLKTRNTQIDLDKNEYKYVSYIDGKLFRNIGSLYSYHKKRYKISNEETSLNTFYKNQLRPTCKCGCGGLTKLKHDSFEFKDFCKGHYVRMKGNNPTRDNPKIAAGIGGKVAATRNKRKLEGKIYTAWNKNLTIDDPRVEKYAVQSRGKTLEERCGIEKAMEIKKRLSKNMKQRYKNDPEFMNYLNQKRKEYWDVDENRNAASERSGRNVEKNSFKKTKLELDFADFLMKTNIPFKHQFMISTKEFGCKSYDFKINDKKILIEVDGNYWHCNPKNFSNGPVTKRQVENIKNDNLKNFIAVIHGYQLYRVWEDDFKNHFDEMKDELIDFITNYDDSKLKLLPLHVFSEIVGS